MKVKNTESLEISFLYIPTKDFASNKKFKMVHPNLDNPRKKKNKNIINNLK